MLKKLLISIALFASFALLLTACGGTENTSNGNSNTVVTENTNKASATSSPAAATSTSAGDKIGVPECDDYLAKYEACVSGKVPESARAQYKSSLELTRNSWRQLAANPQTKPGLVKACQLATDQAKQTFGTFGCNF